MAYEKKWFANGGALFTVKDKKNEKGPDLTGTLDLGDDTVAYIMAQHAAGNREISLDLSAWKKVAGTGTKFLSVSVKKPFIRTGSEARSTRNSEDAPF